VSIDNLVFDVQISLGAGAITRQGFGIPLIVAQESNLNAGFADPERVRSYASASDAADDDDLTSAIKDRISTIFAQSRAPSLVKVGRREADVAQVSEFVVTGNTDGDYTITIDGTDYTFSALGDTLGEIAAGLSSAVDADPDVSATDDGVDTVTVTADTAGTAFTTATTSTGDEITSSTTTENKSVKTELGEIAEADSDFFHFVIDSRTDLDIERAADYASANKRLFWAQAKASDIVGSADTDIFSDLVSESNRWVVPFYYSDDLVYADCAWAGYFAANSFDQEAPTAGLNTLTGVAIDTISTTERTNLEAKGISYYSSLKGVGATRGAQTAGGFDIELVVTGAWIKARLEEAIAELLLDRANSGDRVQYNDQGFRQIDGEALGVLKSGERIGHFTDESTELVGTNRADVAAGDEAEGIYRFEFGTTYSGRVKEVVIRGTVATDFVTLSA